MDIFVHLGQIADQLDDLKLERLADRIDYYITNHTGILHFAEKKVTALNNPIALRTLYKQVELLHDFYKKNLHKFYYFGEEGILAIQAALDQMLALFRVLIREEPQKYDTTTIENYKKHLSRLNTQIERASMMDLTKTKVIIDKFLIYDELEVLMNKIQRFHDQGYLQLQPVAKKCRTINDAFLNLIQQTQEQVAHSDLIKTQ